MDILVAAGYMLFSPVICNHFEILNLHPALPNGPNGTWKSVIKKLIESKSSNSGISIHLMTSDLDEGPNISFCKFNIDNNNNQNLIEIEETEIFSFYGGLLPCLKFPALLQPALHPGPPCRCASPIGYKDTTLSLIHI